MKNFILSAVALLACCMLAVSPAAAKGKHAAHKAAPVKTAAADVTSDLYTKRGATGVLALENLHENGSTCLTCSNGIYGTAGTHNMRSNEF